MDSKLAIQTAHWPYGIRVEVEKGEVVIKPSRHAREGWSEQFKTASSETDELADVRAAANDFDDKEWEW